MIVQRSDLSYHVSGLIDSIVEAAVEYRSNEMVACIEYDLVEVVLVVAMAKRVIDIGID